MVVKNMSGINYMLSELNYVERPMMKLLSSLGWKTLVLDDSQKHDPSFSMRKKLSEVLIESEFCAALKRINPWLKDYQIADLVLQMQNYSVRDLLKANLEVFERITAGLTCDDEESGESNKPVRLIDYFDIDNFDKENTKNSFIAISQFKLQIPGTETHIIPDIILFINGLPLVVIECKSPEITDPVFEGVEQLMRYQNRRNSPIPEGVPELFYYNQFMISTSNQEAKYATITGKQSHFIEWKDPYPYKLSDIRNDKAPSSGEILTFGMLSPSHLLDIVQNYCVFKEDDEGNTIKVVPRYQQYRGARKIIERLRSGVDQFHKGGTVWHTQGSGKSLTMMFVIRKMYNSIDLNDYKIVLLLDRKDLQKQLFETSKSIKYKCNVAKSIKGLKKMIENTTSDVTIAMVHKFGENEGKQEFPVLNTSSKILVMIDEAHRSEYSELAANMWKSMPNSVKVAFTGTPIDKTTDTFGGYIDTYTMRQAVEDEVIVEIIYEGMATDSQITEAEAMNGKFVDIFSFADNDEKHKILGKYTKRGYLEANDVIIAKANNMLDHYINSIFVNGFKAQVVAHTREAAFRYKKAIDELLPQKIAKLKESNPNNVDIACLEKLKTACIISAGNNEEPHLKQFANQSINEDIVDGFKMAFEELDEKEKGRDSSYGILVVQSMLLTGFDAPIEQVMYLDNFIKNHNLLQAIARVNRTYGKNKKCGYIIDYVGVVGHLKATLSDYADADVDEILDVLKNKGQDVDMLKSVFRNIIQFINNQVKVKSLSEVDKIIDELVADEKIREKFNSHFRLFSKYYDRVLPSSEALKFSADYRTLSFIRQSVSNRVRDPKMSMRDASKKIRAIIEEYLIVNGVDPKVSPVSILSTDFDVKNKNKSPRAKCDELTYGIKEYININRPKDPELFDRMSEKLEKVLQLFKDNWAALEVELQNMRKVDIIDGREKEETYGFDPKSEMPFFALMKKEIFDGKDYSDFSEDEFNKLKDLTNDILSTIKTNTSSVNFWGNQSMQDNLRSHIINQLLKSFRHTMKTRKAIAQNIMELAFQHYGGK